MFVDACAIISVITQEPTAADYESALGLSRDRFTSALAAWEATIILTRDDKLACSLSLAMTAVMRWLDTNDVELREAGSPLDVLTYAVAVAEKHGLGKRALSNFDCFHYAHARVAGVPLLTLDRLLRETDVETLPHGP